MTASREARVYEAIDSRAGSNTAMQGLSGILGFPFTAIADVGMCFTHYGPMLNDIRKIYGRRELTAEAILPVVKGCGSELLSDLILDKFMGQIPVIGFVTNMICAKAMTWRMGILFAMLSARGEEINSQSAGRCARLIRELFPQKESLLFKRPSVVVVEKLLTGLWENSQESFDEKVIAILEGLEKK